MAQNSFAIFFMLVLAGCALSLVLAVGDDWARIVSALIREPVAALPPPAYRLTHRAPADLPVVAQRLLPRGGATVERPMEHYRGGGSSARPRRPRQLALPLVVAARH